MDTELQQEVLLWRPSFSEWLPVAWEEWLAFRGIGAERRPLAGVGAGPHQFLVLISVEGEIVNIIRHKYIADEHGALVDANVYELTDAENAAWDSFMRAKEMSPTDTKRLREIQSKASRVLVLSDEAFRALKTSLPRPIKLGSAAQEFMRGGGQRAE